MQRSSLPSPPLLLLFALKTWGGLARMKKANHDSQYIGKIKINFSGQHFIYHIGPPPQRKSFCPSRRQRSLDRNPAHPCGTTLTCCLIPASTAAPLSKMENEHSKWGTSSLRKNLLMPLNSKDDSQSYNPIKKNATWGITGSQMMPRRSSSSANYELEWMTPKYDDDGPLLLLEDCLCNFCHSFDKTFQHFFQN